MTYSIFWGVIGQFQPLKNVSHARKLARWPLPSRAPCHHGPITHHYRAQSARPHTTPGQQCGGFPRESFKDSGAGQMTAAAGTLSYAKMAAAQRGGYTDTEDEASIADQDTAPLAPPGTANSPLYMAPSPASTGSLLGRTRIGLPTTTMTDPHTGMLLCEGEACDLNPAPTDFTSMMQAFS